MIDGRTGSDTRSKNIKFLGRRSKTGTADSRRFYIRRSVLIFLVRKSTALNILNDPAPVGRVKKNH